MSTRQEKSVLVGQRAAAEIDEEIDILEAVRFAHGSSRLPRLAVTAVFEEDANALEVLYAEAKTKRRESTERVARRLATMREFKALAKLAESMHSQRAMMLPPAPEPPRALPPGSGSTRDSFVTIPPAIGSVPPPVIPRAPALPSIPDVSADRTIPLAPITPALANAMAASLDGAGEPRPWARVISMAAIALPACLILAQVLLSPPATPRSPRPAAVALTSEPQTQAAPTAAVDSTSPTPSSEPTPAPSTSSLNAVWDPAGPSVIVHAPRATHRGKGKSAPKPASSVPASSGGLGKELQRVGP